MYNAQNLVVVGPQSKKNTDDNKEHRKIVGAQVVHKQTKQYKKKTSIEVIDSQNMILDSFVGNLATIVSGGPEAGKHLGQLNSDKTDRGEDVFADMPPLEDPSDHDRSPA